MHPYTSSAATALKAREQRQRQLSAARAAGALARLPALVARLRSECGATEVWLFGSLLDGSAHSRSDLDLGISGVSPGAFARALGIASEVSPIPCDLVSMEAAAPSLADWIRQTGRPL